MGTPLIMMKKKKVYQNSDTIREVWAENFEEELTELMKALPKAKLVAMDTEFPGTVYSGSPQTT